MNNLNYTDSKQIIYLATIIVAIGVVLTTTLSESMRPIGVVLIGIGGLLFIIGMNKKHKEENKKDV